MQSAETAVPAVSITADDEPISEDDTAAPGGAVVILEKVEQPPEQPVVTFEPVARREIHWVSVAELTIGRPPRAPVAR